MSRVFDCIFLPGEYVAKGDRLIQNLPLIDTSLYKLCEAKWNLSVEKRYVQMHGRTKLRYQFYNPEKENSFLTFKFWIQGIVENSKLLDLILEKDLTPNFTRVPSFTILPSVVSEEVKQKELSELEMLEKFNTERAKTLPRAKKIDKPSAKLFDLAEYLKELNTEEDERIKYA